MIYRVSSYLIIREECPQAMLWFFQFSKTRWISLRKEYGFNIEWLAFSPLPPPIFAFYYLGGAHKCLTQNECGGQRTTCGIWFSPSTLWAPGMELWLSVLTASTLNPLAILLTYQQLLMVIILHHVGLKVYVHITYLVIFKNLVCVAHARECSSLFILLLTQVSEKSGCLLLMPA